MMFSNLAPMKISEICLPKQYLIEGGGKLEIDGESGEIICEKAVQRVGEERGRAEMAAGLE